MQRFLTLVFVVSLAAYFVSPASAAYRYRSYGHHNHRHGMYSRVTSSLLFF
jgi:hypothetical protein